MPREHIDYRSNLEILNMRFPEKDMLNLTEAMAVMGYHDPKSAKKHIPLTPQRRISKGTLARLMCGTIK